LLSFSQVKATINAARHSTASLGKFTPKLVGNLFKPLSKQVMASDLSFFSSSKMKLQLRNLAQNERYCVYFISIICELKFDFFCFSPVLSLSLSLVI
jgi:hypothetical protein